MGNDRIQIAAGADEAFAFPLAVTLYGAVKHLSAGQGADVHVVDGGIESRSRHRIAKTIQGTGKDVRVHFLKPNLDAINGLPVGNIGAMTYLRLLLPDLLPLDLKHVIYLDSDLLIRGDIAGLWKLRSNAPAAAIPDLGNPQVSSPTGLPNWRELGLSHDDTYFNAGVLIINLSYWRKNDVCNRIALYCRSTAMINRYADQDGINALLCKSIDPLPLDWNVPAYLDSDLVIATLPDHFHIKAAVKNRRQLLRSAPILHFFGRRKPWKTGLWIPCQREWLNQASECGWFRTRRDFGRFVAPIYLDGLIRTAVRLKRKALNLSRKA